MKGLDEHVNLGTYKDEIKVFNVIVSVDSPVCDVQTKRFNKEASELPSDVKIVTVSMDLTFAQSRYCGAEGIDKVETITDHIEGSFGQKYDILIKENRLLGRALFIADKDDTLRHVEYVGEISREPAYEKALNVLKQIA